MDKFGSLRAACPRRVLDSTRPPFGICILATKQQLEQPDVLARAKKMQSAKIQDRAVIRINPFATFRIRIVVYFV